MRQRKADLRFNSLFIIFLAIVALALCQCIFCVPAQAYAQERPYTELIPDYVVFRDPTAVAAGGGLIAVFDKGEVYIIDGDVITSFDSGVTSCDEIAVSAEWVCLLVNKGSRDPNVYSFSLTGEPFDAPWKEEAASDMAICGGDLYFASRLDVRKYDLQSGEGETLSTGNYALYLTADESAVYYQTINGDLLKKVAAEESVLASLAGIETFVAEDGIVYYVNGDAVWSIDAEGTKSVFLDGGAAAPFASVVDIAVADGKLCLTDGVDHAVKVFDLATREPVKTIGSYGDEPGRLRDPIALDVKGGKVVVADGTRGTVFTANDVKLLSGALTSPTDVVIAGDMIYVADEGNLCEYNVGLVCEKKYSIGSAGCHSVTASSDGTIYASSGKEVYRKRTGASTFELFLTAAKEVDGLHVGLGGKTLYVLAGGVLGAYTQDGSRLSAEEIGSEILSVAVDYRGNLFCLNAEGVLRKYPRVLDGYADPVSYSLASAYRSFSDLAISEEGRVYVIADHNVLVYEKETFGVFIAADSTAFADDTPDDDRLSVCEVVKDSVISYMQPDNFEDLIPAGTKLLCYATVNYQGVAYLRVETEKGKAYLQKSDAKLYEPGAAPIKKARCLHAVGVDIYKEPSYLAIGRGEEPIYASLGKESIFDVLSYVAVNDAGADVWGFYWVSYEGVNGYVLVNRVVSVDDDPMPTPPTYKARIKSEGLGKTVPLYREASADSEVIVRLTDGTEISALEPIDKNKEFIKVLYNGEECYVQVAYIGQGGLSGGQILAIVLSVVAVLGSVLTILILRANKKHKRYHKE